MEFHWPVVINSHLDSQGVVTIDGYRSFRPECFDGIKMNYFSYWKQRSGERDDAQEQCRTGEDEWVVRGHSIKEAANQPGREDRSDSSRDDPDRHQEDDLPQNKQHDTEASRTQGYPNTELRRSLGNAPRE
jgi:hypothetical protein